ncbi:hypothetical protein [Roseimaritima sediminicola]|uniref:hypothetical protein n=1 Tax=Roseimaritima sediminicola TaxID=2662066 RepID=UPI001298326B|nr:hypothetical protein [Roseimaritima sediminicola]
MTLQAVSNLSTRRDWVAVLFIGLVLSLPGTLVLGGSLNRLATEKGSWSQAEEEIHASAPSQKARSRRLQRSPRMLRIGAPLSLPKRNDLGARHPVVGHCWYNGLRAPLLV